MEKIVFEIGDWLISSGALVSFFVFLWKYLKPLLEEKRKHAKTMQTKELLAVLDSLADNAVSSLVSNNEASGNDKFKQAINLVNTALTSKNLTVDQNTVATAIQSAYEKSDLTPTTIETTTETPSTEEPQTGVIIHD